MNALLLGADLGGQSLIASMILLIAVAFVVVVWAMASRYKKIPPNQVGIFYGRKYKYLTADGRLQSRGFRVVAGGGSGIRPQLSYVPL